MEPKEGRRDARTGTKETAEPTTATASSTMRMSNGFAPDAKLGAWELWEALGRTPEG